MSTTSTTTTEIDQPVDWFDMMETEFIRYRDSGLDHHGAMIAAFDVVRFRRHLAGQTIRLVTTPAEPIPDVDGMPLAVSEAVYDRVAFTADERGDFATEWVGGDR